MRTLRAAFVLGFVLMTALGVTRSDAAKVPPAAAGRFTRGLDPFADLFMTRLLNPSLDPDAGKLYQRDLADFGKPSGSAQDDIGAAHKIFNRHHVLQHKVPEGFDTGFLDAVRAAGSSLADYVDQDVTAFEEKITDFDQDNPTTHTSRQHKALTAARALIDQARLAAPDKGQAFVSLFSAESKIDAVRKLDHVFAPPKSCVGKGHSVKEIALEPGEYCHGTFQVTDLDTDRPATIYFEANRGSASTATPTGGAPYTYIEFGYCDGATHDLILFNFTVSGAGPSYAVDNGYGSFRHGVIGFGGAMQAGSSVTVTSGAITAGVLEGTFSFNAYNGSGTGSFRVYVDF